MGLPQDAKVFRTRARTYQDQISSIRKKREDAELYWKDLEKKYLALKDGTQKKITDLNKQVNQLQGEIREVASQPKTERVVVTPIVRPWNYPPPPSLSGPILLPHRPGPSPFLLPCARYSRLTGPRLEDDGKPFRRESAVLLSPESIQGMQLHVP